MAPGSRIKVVFGLCSIAAGIYAYHHMGRFIETSREASGVVVEVEYVRPTLQKGRMHPVVRFRASDGRDAVGRTEKHYNAQPGDTLQVLYDPASPERIEIGTLAQARKQQLFFSGGAIVLGLALILGTVAIELALLKRRPDV